MKPASESPTLLLVHGAWHGAWCWEDEFAPYLRQQGLQVVTMNLPGHGHPGPEKLPWFSIADYIEAVAAKLVEIGHPTVVLGHSMGGYVAQKLMERPPAELAGVILLAPATRRGVWAIVGNILRHRPLHFLTAISRRNLYHLVRTPALASALFHSEALPEATLHDHWRRLGNESFRAFLDMLALAPIRANRVSAELPKLILGGGKDAVFPPDIVIRCAESYGISATMYDGLPHCLQQDPGWRPVADDIARWLRQEFGS